MKRVAIFGATSGIAVAVARRLAEAGGARLVLVGRDAEALAGEAADLTVRGATLGTLHADFAETATLGAVAAAAWDMFGGLDLALIAYGSLPDQPAAEADSALAEAALVLNFASPVLLCNALAPRFAAQRGGVIAAITSVAGDRGRASNHLYGAAKGGLQVYLGGLRHRLFAAGVQVLDIRPGFVATAMTAHLPQTGPLWVQPDRVAADILRAVARRRAVLYTPWFWRCVMLIIRSLPRALLHRSKL